MATTTGTWAYDNGTATYTYTDTNDTTIKVRVQNVTGTDGLEVDEENRTVTVPETLLGKDTASPALITTVDVVGSEPESETPSASQFTFVLGEDVYRTADPVWEWKDDKSAVEYRKKVYTNYAVDQTNSQRIDYTADELEVETQREVLVSLTGVNDALTSSTDLAAALEVNGTVITVNADALGEGNLAVASGDYTLALGTDVSKPTTADPKWNISSGTAKYDKVTSAGYTLDTTNNKTINRTEEVTNTLVTLTGVNTTKSPEDIKKALEVNDKVIKVGLAALGDNGIKIDDAGGTSDYTLELDDVAEPTADDPHWVVQGVKKTTTATYQQATEINYKVKDGNKEIERLDEPDSSTKVIKLATITGLAADLTVADINDGGIDVDPTKNEFNLHLKVLGGAVKLTTIKQPAADTKYKLSLDKDATEPQCSWTVSNKGVAAYNKVEPITYTLNDDNKDTITGEGKAKTETLATVSGVNSGLIGASAEKLNEALKVTEKDTGVGKQGTDGSTITLGEEAFGMANLTYANAGTSKYTFSATGINTEEGTPAGPQWVINGTTATYINCESQAHYTEEPVLDKKGKPTGAKYFQYHAPVPAPGAQPQITITGLKKGVTLQGDGTINGISPEIEESTGKKTGKILISKELFSGTNIAISGSYYDEVAKKNVDYTLKFAEDAADLHETEANGGSYAYTDLKKGASSITQNVDAGYTLTANGKGILYSKAGGSAVVATVAGIKSKLTADNFVAATGVITLTKDQLPDNPKGATVTVTGTGGCTFDPKIANFNEATTEPAWSVSGTTATYKVTVEPTEDKKYSLSADGKSLFYLVKAKDTVIATVNGINANLTEAELNDDTKPVISFKADGNGEKTIIVLKKRALTSANISAAAGYSIAFGEGEDVYTSEKEAEAAPAKDTWVVNGTKAELISCKPAYYVETPGKKGITTYVYHKAEPVADAKPTVTLTGLKKNLMVNADGSIDGIKITPGATGEPSTITLDSKVLGGGTVTVDGNYKLDLYYNKEDPNDKGNVQISEITYKWEAAKDKKGNTTGRTLTQTRTNGYDVSDDGKTITHSWNKKDDSTTTSLFTLTGINKTYLDNNDNWDEYDKDSLTNDISLKDDTISINSKDVLGDAPLTVGAKSAYKLAIGFKTGEEAATDNKWEVIEGKKGALSYAYKRVVTSEGGYALSADAKTISSMKANDSVTLFTINGLNEDLIVRDGENKIDAAATDAEIKKAVAVSEKDGTVTLGKKALGTSVISVAKGSTYKLQLADDANIKTSAAEVSSNGWVVSGTTAKYQICKNGYYTHNAAKNTITYTPPSADTTGSATVELKGLKKGIAADQDGKIDGVVMDNAEITLKKSALGTTNVEVFGTINGAACTLKLYSKTGDDESVPTSKTTTEWAPNPKNATSWTYNRQVEPGYTLEIGSKKVTYAAGTNPTALFTLNGLNEDLTEDDLNNKANTPIKVDGTTVTLGKDALAGTNVTLALPKKSTDTYILALGNSVDQEAGDATGKEWIVSGTTAIYYDKCTQPYYTVSDNTVTYHPAAITAGVSEAIIEITGLRKGTTLADGDISIEGTEVTLSESLLAGTSKVTIKGKNGNGEDYTLALGEGVTKSVPEDPIWTVTTTNKGTTATLTQVQPKGYICNGSSITAVPKQTTATLVTLSGINAKLIETAKTAADAVTDAGGYGTLAKAQEATRQAKYKEVLNYNTTTETVTVGNDAFMDNGTIAVGKGSTYTIAAANEAKVTGGVWRIVAKKNTATYTETKEKGNITSADGKSIKNSTNTTDTALVTIAGFNAELPEEKLNDKDTTPIMINTEKQEITLKKDALDPSKTVVIGTKGSPYTFELHSGVTTTSEDQKGWVITGSKKDSKAEYIMSTPAHYKLGTGDKSVSYVPTTAIAGEKALITINGLAKGAVVSGDNIKLEGSEVTLKKSVLGTGTITIEGKASSTSTQNATIKLYNNASDDNDPENVPISVLGKAKWSFSNGKKGASATLTQVKPAGYVPNKDGSVTYVAKTTTVTLATVSGINPGLLDGITDEDEQQEILNEALAIDGNKITLNNKAIVAGTTNVTLTRGKDIEGTATQYELAIGGSVVTGGEDPQWYVDGQTVKYIECENAHYELANNHLSISYQKVKPAANAEAKATISGLRKKFAPTEGDITKDVEIKKVEGGTSQVVVSENLLKGSGKVTLDGNYTFEFKDDMTTPTHKAANIEQKWTNTEKKGVITATLTQDREIGYTISNDGKSIMNLTKLPKGGSFATLVMATITGLKDVNETLSSNAGDTTINLGANDLRETGGVTVDGAGYTFNFDNTYKENTITAGNSGDIINAAGDKLTITGGKGNDNITVSGQAANVANINGGAGNDVINASVISSATVAGGAGDDKITFNGKGGNTYVYNIGEGNDVVNNFKTGDTIKLNSYLASKFTSGSVKLEKDGSDLVVTVAVGVKKKQGTITLVGAASEDVKFVDNAGADLSISQASSSNAVEDPVVPTNELLYSSNYSQDAAQLDQVTPTSVNDYSVGDINTNQDATALTQNATIVTTSTNKK